MYIVIWNPTSRDPHISVDYDGKIEQFPSIEDAKKDSEECKDNEHYRSYAVIEFNPEK